MFPTLMYTCHQPIFRVTVDAWIRGQPTHWVVTSQWQVEGVLPPDRKWRDEHVCANCPGISTCSKGWWMIRRSLKQWRYRYLAHIHASLAQVSDGDGRVSGRRAVDKEERVMHPPHYMWGGARVGLVQGSHASYQSNRNGSWNKLVVAAGEYWSITYTYVPYRNLLIMLKKGNGHVLISRKKKLSKHVYV